MTGHSRDLLTTGSNSSYEIFPLILVPSILASDTAYEMREKWDKKQPTHQSTSIYYQGHLETKDYPLAQLASFERLATLHYFLLSRLYCKSSKHPFFTCVTEKQGLSLYTYPHTTHLLNSSHVKGQTVFTQVLSCDVNGDEVCSHPKSNVFLAPV